MLSFLVFCVFTWDMFFPIDNQASIPHDHIFWLTGVLKRSLRSWRDSGASDIYRRSFHIFTRKEIKLDSSPIPSRLRSKNKITRARNLASYAGYLRRFSLLQPEIERKHLCDSSKSKPIWLLLTKLIDISQITGHVSYFNGSLPCGRTWKERKLSLPCTFRVVISTACCQKSFSESSQLWKPLPRLIFNIPLRALGILVTWYFKTIQMSYLTSVGCSWWIILCFNILTLLAFFWSHLEPSYRRSKRELEHWDFSQLP